MTVDRERILAALRARREDIERRYGVRMVGVVGSVARGEARADSDVDVMVDIVRTPTLFELSDAEHDLEEAIGLGLPVELVLREAMRPSGRALMERDLIPL